MVIIRMEGIGFKRSQKLFVKSFNNFVENHY